MQNGEFTIGEKAHLLCSGVGRCSPHTRPGFYGLDRIYQSTAVRLCVLCDCRELIAKDNILYEGVECIAPREAEQFRGILLWVWGMQRVLHKRHDRRGYERERIIIFAGWVGQRRNTSTIRISTKGIAVEPWHGKMAYCSFSGSQCET